MALFKRSKQKSAGKPGEWYYCLEHKRVEEGPQCKALNRLLRRREPRGRIGELRR